MTQVTVSNIEYTYPGQQAPAVAPFELSIQSGELLCLVGPSGCGKTTLLKMISGLLRPDRGCLLFDGKDVINTPPERRGAVLVFQNQLLFPFLSVVDNVGFALRMRGEKRKDWIPVAHSMLERVRLTGYEDRLPHHLSAGQQQRVALARALVARPKVLLLDEPLANLDRHLREEMRQVILRLQRDDKLTTVCVTHDQEEAVLLGDRIAMMADGALQQVGPVQDFYESPSSVAVARFFGNPNQLEGVRDGRAVSWEQGTITLPESDAIGWPETGPVCVHIRPERLRIMESDQTAINPASATVRQIVQMGTHVRYGVQVGDAPWLVIRPTPVPGIAEGDPVTLDLGPDYLWLTDR